MAGAFVVFEGPEGAGKSTQLRRLAERLEAAGHSVLLTREPGGTPAGEAIRGVLLDPALRIDPLGEFLLYSASRAQHVAEVIRPALARGQVVVSDRFAAASIAYQGYGRGLELGFIAEITERATGGLHPDLTVLLDLAPDEGLARVGRRGGHDRLESEDLAFHERVREGFLRQAEADGSWVVLDAARTVAELDRAIWDAVRPRLEAA